MSSNKCAKCGSGKMVSNARLYDQGGNTDGTLKAAFDQNPAAWLFKGRVMSDLRAIICGECGFTELYVQNPARIYEAFQPSKDTENASIERGDDRFTERFVPHPAKIYDELPEESEDAVSERCLKCGARMPDEVSECKTCGWTYLADDSQGRTVAGE